MYKYIFAKTTHRGGSDTIKVKNHSADVGLILISKISKKHERFGKFIIGRHKPLYLWNFYVKEKYQRQGIGRNILKLVKEKYKGKELFLECRKDNNAYDLYLSEGFETVDTFNHCGEWAIMKLNNI